MIFDIDRVVDLAVSGPELGIINLSVLNPLLHIIVRELGMQKHRVLFKAAIAELSVDEFEFKQRIFLSDLVDPVDGARIVVINEEEMDSTEEVNSGKQSLMELTQRIVRLEEAIYKLETDAALKYQIQMETIEANLAELKNKQNQLTEHFKSDLEALRNQTDAMADKLEANIFEETKCKQETNELDPTTTKNLINNDIERFRHQLFDQLRISEHQFENYKRSLENDFQSLQNDLRQALAEVQQMLNAKFNKCDVSEMKQYFLDLIESNRKKILSEMGLQSSTDAVCTTKRLKDVQCLVCSQPVEQCQIDVPKKVRPWVSSVQNGQSEDRRQGRICGGSHTIMLAEERIAKKCNFLQSFGEPPTKTSYVMGSDGRYYMGGASLS